MDPVGTGASDGARVGASVATVTGAGAGTGATASATAVTDTSDGTGSGASAATVTGATLGTGRFDAFSALESTKRDRIINAALEEFIDKGFKLASTNAIAKSAKIGKGMLFYYFGSKRELFDFLCEYAVEFIRHEFIGKFDGETGDFIERQRRLANAKRKAIEKRPLLFALFGSIYGPKNAEYASKNKDTLEGYRSEFMAKLYDGVDESLFRSDIDSKSAVRYVAWLLERYSSEIERKIKSGEDVVGDESEWTRFDAFIDDLRKLFYREGARNTGDASDADSACDAGRDQTGPRQRQ